MEANKKFRTVDEYLSSLPPKKKSILKEFRKTIKETAPAAKEVISYNMPSFKLHRNLVWYAALKEHIGFYPTPSAIIAFENELAKFKTSKGAIQFPIGETIPLSLVKKIVKFRVKEDEEKAKKKK